MPWRNLVGGVKREANESQEKERRLVFAAAFMPNVLAAAAVLGVLALLMPNVIGIAYEGMGIAESSTPCAGCHRCGGVLRLDLIAVQTSLLSAMRAWKRGFMDAKCRMC